MKKSIKKKGTTSPVGKKGKADKKEPDIKPIPSLIELAELEKNLPPKDLNKPDGSGRKYTRELFKLWLSLPDVFRGTKDRIKDELGITDEVTLAMLDLPTIQSFGQRFSVHPGTLSFWRKEIEESDDFLGVVKAQMKKLTKNIMGALYRNATKNGNAAEFKAWMEVIEGWKQQLGIDHSGSVEMLSTEEKTVLDALLKKNTA